MTLVPSLPLLPEQTVFAIDPGNFDTAYFLLGGDKKIGCFGKVANEDFIAQLRAAVENKQQLGLHTVFAVEMVELPVMAWSQVRLFFETALMIGRIREIVGPELRLLPRSSVKSVIKGRNDSEIRTRLIEQYGKPGTKKAPGATRGIVADMWAAFALAETVRRGNYKPYIFSFDKSKK